MLKYGPMNSNESKKREHSLIIIVDTIEILKLCFEECGNRLMN